MAHFAPVAPIQVLEEMYAYSPRVFGEYHLLLAHHTVAEAKRFNELFRKIAADGHIHPTIIMDNSVVECGGYVNFDMMQEATAIVQEHGHDVIPVLPDVMGDGKLTREATLEAYSKWEHGIPCAGFMAVCQGATWNDYLASVQLFSNRSRFRFMEILGVPRVLVKTLSSRNMATRIALQSASDTDMKVHLLGYSDDTNDDLECSLLDGVHGNDSAVPLRVDRSFVFGGDDGPRPADWFETARLNSQMLENLHLVRKAHEV